MYIHQKFIFGCSATASSQRWRVVLRSLVVYISTQILPGLGTYVQWRSLCRTWRFRGISACKKAEIRTAFLYLVYTYFFLLFIFGLLGFSCTVALFCITKWRNVKLFYFLFSLLEEMISFMCNYFFLICVSAGGILYYLNRSLWKF